MRHTQAHVDRCLLGSALAHNVISGPVEAVQDDGGAARFADEYLDRQQIGLLRNAIGFTTDSACNVGSVTDSVNVLAASGVVGKAGAALKFLVLGVDTSVHDISIGSLAAGRVINIVSAGLALVGDAAQSPWRVRLSGQFEQMPDLVFFNLGNLTWC